jgi:predicted small metal-binding protein
MCKDLGLPNCSFIAKGHTEDEVIATMMEHAMITHPEQVKEMLGTMSREEIGEMFREKIRREI